MFPLPPPEAPPPVCALPLFEAPQENEEMSILFIEVLDLRLAIDVVEFENHVNGHIKLLLVIFNEMLTARSNTQHSRDFPSGFTARRTRRYLSALALRQRRDQAHADVHALQLEMRAAARHWPSNSPGSPRSG